MSKKGLLAGILGLTVVVGTAFLGSNAQASESIKKPLLTPDKVLGASTMGDLEFYYNYMGQLYVTGQINQVTYEVLYRAYVTRFYQLVGVK